MVTLISLISQTYFYSLNMTQRNFTRLQITNNPQNVLKNSWLCSTRPCSFYTVRVISKINTLVSELFLSSGTLPAGDSDLMLSATLPVLPVLPRGLPTLSHNSCNIDTLVDGHFTNKTGKVYFLEYTDTTKAFFTPNDVGQCCTNVNRGHRTKCSNNNLVVPMRSKIITAQCSNNGIISHCCTCSTMKTSVRTITQQWPLVMHVVYPVRKTWQHKQEWCLNVFFAHARSWGTRIIMKLT
jgi:hypothetical protein